MICSKKSQINVQFNWIFILIAGGLIIGFFFLMAMQQKDTAEQVINVKMKENIGSIFEGARTSSGTSTIIRTAPLDMNFVCDESGYSVYDINGVSNQMSSEVIFAPSTLEGRNFITWSHVWNMPFQVMNFLFVSNQRTRYVILGEGDDDTFQYINDTIPKEFVVDFYDLNDYADVDEAVEQIDNLNDDHMRVIYVNVDVNYDPNFPFFQNNFVDEGNPVSVLQIESLPSTPDTGDLFFFEYTKNPPRLSYHGIESAYAGGASLFGAVFSETKEFYECTMQKALGRFDLVNQIYWKRTEEMEDSYRDSGDTRCTSFFGGAVGPFSSINTSAHCARFPDSQTCGTFQESLKEMASTAQELEEDNRDAKTGSCDLIY